MVPVGSKNEHCIPKGIEPVFFLSGGLVSFQDFFPSGERADQH